MLCFYVCAFSAAVTLFRSKQNALDWIDVSKVPVVVINPDDLF